MLQDHLLSRPGVAGTATGNRDSYPPEGGWQQPLLSAAHGIRGPRRLALSHVVQVSTLRGRACMVTAGCLLASEQLVSISEHTRAICGPAGGVLKTKGKKGKCSRDRVPITPEVGRTGNRLRHQACTIPGEPAMHPALWDPLPVRYPIAGGADDPVALL